MKKRKQLVLDWGLHNHVSCLLSRLKETPEPTATERDTAAERLCICTPLPSGKTRCPGLTCHSPAGYTHQSSCKQILSCCFCLSTSPAILNFTLENPGQISSPGTAFASSQTPERSSALLSPVTLQQRSTVFIKPASPVPVQQGLPGQPLTLISVQQVNINS
ncbi:hypothetical protein ILYODFUR_037516 [Ilyodon furcidens]|uniref:Uncharacterized protein n=1 Tax=Ilyodon furcidens TaxID=33524 RepID=A0ABV0VMR6_9TELE